MKKLFLAFLATGLLSACSVENIVEVTPVMVTYEPQNILTTSASMGGVTMSEGGNPILEYGIVYGTGQFPGVNDNKFVVGSRIGDYYNNYEGLVPGTTYFYRAFGTNITGTGYGETYSFTTQEEAPCEPAQDNKVNVGYFAMDILVNDVVHDIENLSFDDGNLQFYTEGTSTGGGNFVITLQFNELNRRLPLTGTYTTVWGFDQYDPKSNGDVKIHMSTNGIHGSMAARGAIGEKIYIENNDGQITFIFCDTKFNDQFTLNGKFTYTE